MKHALLLAVLIASPALAAERGLTLTDFDRVRVEGPYVVDITTGKSASGKLIGTPQAFDRITVQVQDHTLVIRPNRSGWGGNPDNDGGPVRVKITVPTLRTAWVNGSGVVTIAGMRGAALDLVLQGSGSLSVSGVQADRLSVGTTGAGSATVSGKASQVTITTRGGGALDASTLATQDIRVSNEGSGDIKAAASRSAKVTSSGVGNIVISGRPACIVSNVGAGSVVCGAK
jgi:hypothetical protein